ncbi:hypothetical protein L1D51_19060 [Pseudoalteromonas shioyasakiensis]|uniref:hypothetical protein n=1 Tax=Pseudoalteromonas shioyasakiensis TaxID=1190813 RepID=UPI001EFEB972|nr:hypothetical protein [Pseudoalteromonas shioyasakiensis]MCG9736068.1 hypothetical protein [Pseudoalteromonas shioyasakiensis]
MWKNEYWGGQREGAGRPRKEPTKPVRLNELEQKIISLIRDKDLLDLTFTFVQNTKK